MLTYTLSCAFLFLLAAYYLVLKQKSLIRTLLKYRDMNPMALMEVVGSELNANLHRHKHVDKEPFVKVVKVQEEKVKDIHAIPGPAILPVIGTRWQYLFRYNLPKIHEAYMDLHQRYGDIVLEVGNGHPYLHLFNRHDIEKVLRVPSKYPFRPPLEIVVEYRKTRPDRYATSGLVQE